MKKFLVSALSVGTLIAAPAAIAQSPHSYPWTLTGVVTVQKGAGPILTCGVEVVLDLVGTPAVKKATSITLTDVIDPRCASVIFENDPYDTTYDPITHDLTIHGIYANTTITTGDCEGDLVAEWDDIGGKYDVSGSLPEALSGGDCTVAGEIYP